MKTCLHCGETFYRHFDGALGTLKHKQLKDGLKATVEDYFPVKECFSTVIDKDIIKYVIYGGICPKCNKTTIILSRFKEPKILTLDQNPSDEYNPEEIPIYPLFNERPVNQAVPAAIAEDYKEATRISGISRKGAATLARRCLQRTLRHSYPNLGKQPSLKHEIDWVIKNTDLDDIFKDVLHTLRDAGNFGAHPSEDGLSEVYELSQEDLEDCFLLLDALFDILYVRPALKKEKLSKLKKRIPPSKK